MNTGFRIFQIFSPNLAIMLNKIILMSYLIFPWYVEKKHINIIISKTHSTAIYIEQGVWFRIAMFVKSLTTVQIWQNCNTVLVARKGITKEDL